MLIQWGNEWSYQLDRWANNGMLHICIDLLAWTSQRLHPPATNSTLSPALPETDIYSTSTQKSTWNLEKMFHFPTWRGWIWKSPKCYPGLPSPPSGLGGLFGDGDTDTSGSSGSSGSGGFGGLFDDTKTDAAKGPMNLGVFLLGGERVRRLDPQIYDVFECILMSLKLNLKKNWSSSIFMSASADLVS